MPHDAVPPPLPVPSNVTGGSKASGLLPSQPPGVPQLQPPGVANGPSFSTDGRAQKPRLCQPRGTREHSAVCAWRGASRRQRGLGKVTRAGPALAGLAASRGEKPERVPASGVPGGSSWCGHAAVRPVTDKQGGPKVLLGQRKATVIPPSRYTDLQLPAGRHGDCPGRAPE